MKLSPVILIFILIACSSSPSTPGSATSVQTKSEQLPALDACSLLDKSIIEKALGGPVAESKLVLSDAGSAKAPAISQCTHYGGKNNQGYIGILIQKDPFDNSNPKSKEEYMKKLDEGYMIGLEPDAKKEIAKATKVNGLGELAFSYNYISQNLTVFWKGNYMMIISVVGRSDKEALMEDEVMVAKKIIENLK